MPARIRALLDKVLEWWNKFTTKQKTLIISVISGAVVTVIILVTVLNQPRYVLLVDAESTKEASEVTDLLSGEGITYVTSSDGLQIKVLEKDEATASLLLGANDIPSVGYSIDNVTTGSFSTTESDKQKKYVYYLESRLESQFITSFDAIEEARVELNIPENNGTLISETKEASASIVLQLNPAFEFNEDNASYLARAVSTALGNTTTNNIVILDTAGNMLFSGSEESTVAGLASTQLTVKSKAEQQLKNSVKSVLLGTNKYDNIEVASNLVIDFSNIENVTHNYTPADDQTQGVLSHEDTYTAENVNGISGIPGTDSNEDDETTYVTQDNENSSSTIEEISRDYLPNESITTTTTPGGTVNYDDSSISVTAINYVIVKEDDYVPSEHGDMDWEAYKAANVDPVVIEEDLTSDIDVIAKATGIATGNIALAAYNQNVYFDSEGTNISLTDILQIVLILVILGLLAFVVLRSMMTEKQQQEEEEVPEQLSVEQLLESQPMEEALENIEMDEGSETKRLIEKFIDENPEAAANLLRNWLNEEYS
ncbi:MAG: flagellar M-ring protein FliF [Butyrivibrio sp.]|nr:flagellar M-ring protein FliF [Butyrivibrio sp.]